MLNWWLRYAPVVEHARETAPRRVLDVGSGWHGLSWYWPGEVVNTDLRFGAETRPDEAQRQGRAHFVTASVDQLPFADRAFDLVVCLDLFEHLPVALHQPALRELVRVGGDVVVGFPCGSTARRTDRRTLTLMRRWGIDTPLWLQEHLDVDGYPDAQTVTRALPPGAHLVSVRPNSNHWVHLFVLALEHRPRLARVPASVERRLARTGPPRWSRALHRGRAYRQISLVRSRG